VGLLGCFRSGFGRGPHAGLELKFVSKLTKARVRVLFSDALRSGKREGIGLKLGFFTCQCFCVG